MKRLIMGRNKETGQAIGFCFIEYVDSTSCLRYYNHEDAAQAVEYLNLLKYLTAFNLDSMIG